MKSKSQMIDRRLYWQAGIILFEAAVSKKRGILAATLLDAAIKDLAERLQLVDAIKNRARLEGPDGERVLDSYLTVVQQTDGWIGIHLSTSHRPKWMGKPSARVEGSSVALAEEVGNLTGTVMQPPASRQL